MKNKTHELCLIHTCLCLIRHAKDTILNNLYVHYHDKSHCDISTPLVKDPLKKGEKGAKMHELYLIPALSCIQQNDQFKKLKVKSIQGFMQPPNEYRFKLNLSKKLSEVDDFIMDDIVLYLVQIKNSKKCSKTQSFPAFPESHISFSIDWIFPTMFYLLDKWYISCSHSQIMS